ncbi:MAG: extracellular solute-binding protein, partial [Paenibacillus sp.]|nr:extracellular solute-binding protein [Paenibacillus sp.]
EWVSGLSTEESWQTKVLNNSVAIGNDFYTRPSWFMLNGGTKNDPNFSLKVMPPFLDETGKQSKFPTVPVYRTDRAFVINAKSADKAPAIIQFLDYLYSEKGQTLVGWGVEGTTFKSAGGKKEFTVKFDEESTKPLGTTAWTFFQDRLTFPIPVNNEAFYEWNHSLTKAYASDYFSKYSQSFPILKYSTDELKERSNLVAKTNEAIKANIVKFVTGKRPIAEWDAFIKEMDVLGYSKIVEIDQKAYDAIK